MTKLSYFQQAGLPLKWSVFGEGPGKQPGCSGNENALELGRRCVMVAGLILIQSIGNHHDDGLTKRFWNSFSFRLALIGAR
jgi:hypothetical protein